VVTIIAIAAVVVGAALLGALLPEPRNNIWLRLYIVGAAVGLNLGVAIWRIRARRHDG
jgi:hypothetical protein